VHPAAIAGPSSSMKVRLDFANQPSAQSPPRLCAATAELFNPPALAGPRAIPLIGTFPVAPEPAGRENPAIAAEPACPPPCPPRANEAAGGVKTMNNAIATVTAVLDMGSASMIHWDAEAVRLM
jgi:hypothetical protein